MGEEDQRKKQGTRLDRSKRLLGTLGVRVPGGTTEGGSDFCAAEMSIERGRGGGDFHLETARCHKRELGG